MYPSLRRPHQPLIRFIGRRQWPSSADTPHPHPAASAEFREHFAQFLKKQQSLTSASVTSAPSYNQFWEAPLKFWKPKVRELEEAEVEAIMSGGATSYNRN